MTQISTPSPQGPSAATLDFLMKFARTYKPRKRLGEYVDVLLESPGKALGEC